VDIDALMGGASKKSDEAGEEANTPAERLLREWLADADRWPMLADDAYQAGVAAGISHRTLQRTALEKLGIRSQRSGFGGKVVWHRPHTGHEPSTHSSHESGQ
jgi:hypothetical protein